METAVLWHGTASGLVQDTGNARSTENRKVLFIFLIKYLFYLCVCVPVCIMFVCVPWRSEDGTNPWELGVQAVPSHPTWGSRTS